MDMFEVRLELAVNPDYENGSDKCGYMLQLPLTEDYFIDEAAYEKHAERFKVTRYWENEPERSGRLVRKWKHTWHLEYTNNEIEPIFQLDKERLVLGEFIDIRDHGNRMHVFKIVSLSSMEDTDVQQATDTDTG